MKNIVEVVKKPIRPEKVLCFGEGNFLRAFTAVVVQNLNDNVGFNGSIVLLQGVENGMSGMINAQNGLYTVIERGAVNGKAVENFKLIDSVSRCIDPYKNYDEYLKLAENPELKLIVSNTTEFGICYDEKEEEGQQSYRNFPAKLADFLLKRYDYFKGAPDKGLIVLPCELIENNGEKLKGCVLRYAKKWNLKSGFIEWFEKNIVFADTLVDRIVSGYPKAEADEICQKLGYVDNLLDVCEPFFLWVVQTNDARVKQIPFEKCGLDIIVTSDFQPYRTRKVRILNGAHTMSVLAGHLCGLETVEQLVKDKTFNAYIRKGLFEEIVPSFSGESLKKYAEDVIGRFFNPFLNHKLLSIALNSISKFKTRVLPSIKDYAQKFKKAPGVLSFSLAACFEFYKTAGGAVQDEKAYLDEVAKIEDVKTFMKSKVLWDEDLTAVDGLCEAVEKSYDNIKKQGVKDAVKELIHV